MLKSIRSSLCVLSLAVAAIGLSGCQSASVASLKAVVLDPNNDAKAVQVVATAGANRFLANNPSYSGDVLSLADAFTALATANTALLSVADVQATLDKTSLTTAQKAEFTSDFATAQGILLNDFNVTLPALKPIYGLWLQALANGLYIAIGHVTVPLPVIPPAATATVTPTG